MQIFLSHIDTLALKAKTADFIDYKALSERYKGKRLDASLSSRYILYKAIEYLYHKKIDFDFYQGAHGKPYFKDNFCYFNLSHCRNVIVLIIDNKECGIDLEAIKQRRNMLGLARKVMYAQELDHFINLKTDSEKTDFFINMWTVRECLLKQSGLGLVGLDGIKIQIRDKKIEAQDNQSGFTDSIYLDESKIFSFASNNKDENLIQTKQNSSNETNCFYLTYFKENKDTKPQFYLLDDGIKAIELQSSNLLKVN